MFGMSETQTISPEVRAYMSAIGRKKQKRNRRGAMQQRQRRHGARI